MVHASESPLHPFSLSLISDQVCLFSFDFAAGYILTSSSNHNDGTPWLVCHPLPPRVECDPQPLLGTRAHGRHQVLPQGALSPSFAWGAPILIFCGDRGALCKTAIIATIGTRRRVCLICIARAAKHSSQAPRRTPLSRSRSSAARASTSVRICVPPSLPSPHSDRLLVFHGVLPVRQSA
jgi:hypothetical protein